MQSNYEKLRSHTLELLYPDYAYFGMTLVKGKHRVPYEITITDVLRVLEPHGKFVIQANGVLGYWEVESYRQETFVTIANIRLLEPLSHPSNDKACESVLNLITSNK